MENMNNSENLQNSQTPTYVLLPANEERKPWGAYIFSAVGDLICVWWAYVFVVMTEDLLLGGTFIAALSYYLWLFFLGPPTIGYAVVGFIHSRKAKKGKKLFFVTGITVLLFLILPVLIYLLLTFILYL